MKKPFAEYTNAELLTISNEELNDALRIQAINQGITPPVSLPEALRKSEWAGYQLPAESITVYELHVGGYGGTGAGYLTMDKAQSALDGLVRIEHGYGNTAPKLKDAEAKFMAVHIGVTRGSSKFERFEEFTQNTEAFDKMVDECMDRLSSIRQAAYDAKVRAEKRKEYLRLANDNEQVAIAFWNKVEIGPWPDADEEYAPKQDIEPTETTQAPPAIADDLAF
jgi:hypothetical protein